jgi:hypothetical protein
MLQGLGVISPMEFIVAALLQDAVANGNTSYDPMGAAQVIYVEARDKTTVTLVEVQRALPLDKLHVDWEVE